MSRRDLDACFARFCRDRDPRALAAVFERAAPALLRRARRMLRDRGAAEDVVQELFVSLLRNGTSYDERRPCLPFLVGSLRRHAVRWQRRRALAPLGDAEFASADHSDPAGGAARREAFAAIHAAIAGLPASCRQAVADYLETGLSPREIARRTGERAGTVRVRIHRGLVQLRQRLPILAPVLLALLARRAPSAARPAVAVSPLRRHAVALAAVAAGAFVALALALASGATAAVAPAATFLADPARVTSVAALDPTVAPRPSVRDVAAPASHGAFALRVRQGNGAALPNVGVRIWPAGSDDDFALLAGATDANGALRLGGLTPGEHVVALDRGERRTIVVPAGATAECAITVPAGATLRGVVCDASGAPVADAAIWVCHAPRHPWDGQIVGRSGPDGAFALLDMPAMSVLAAIVPGRVPSPVQAVGPAAERSVRLVVGGVAATLRGRVLGPLGPIAGAIVRVGRHPRAGYTLPGGDQFAAVYPGAVAVTGARGGFELTGLPPGRLEALVRAVDWAPALAAFVAEGGGATELTLRVAAAAKVTGRVRDTAGRPIAGASVVAQGRSHRFWAAAESASDGSFELVGLDARRIELEVAEHDYRPRTVIALPGEHLGDLRLERLPVLAGELLGANGGAVDVAAFELGMRESGDGDLTRPRPVALDARGRFAVTAVDPAATRFLVRQAGGAVWHQCEVRGELLAPRVEVPADIGRAGRLVLVRRGFDADELADFEVFAQRGAEVYRIEPDAPADVGELEEFDERAAARLEITALPVGSWHVYVFGRRGVCPALDLGELELTAAGCEVEVEAPPRGHLRYRCRCADGSAVEQLRAFLADDSGRQVPLREPSGRVTVPAGRWRLFASSTVFPAVLGREIAVVAGCETELDLCLPRGHMRHLAFYLPAGVAPSRCAVHLARDGAPVLGRGTGLTDSGFDHGSDGYCSVAMALADGSYRLELETELGDWFAEFELRGGCDDGEPVLAALRPR